MADRPLQLLVSASLEARLIDRHSIDQDGSNVIVIGETVHYLSDAQAADFLDELLRAKGVFPGKNKGSAPEA